jgi:hypothetical protein
MFACLDLKFHKELKLLINLKTLLGETISNFYYYLKNSIEKIRIQNTILILFKSYRSIIAKEILTK